MAMKKKPPPGATLIARLREQRLAREAAAKQAEEGGEPEAAPDVSAAGDVKPAGADAPAAGKKPAGPRTGRSDAKTGGEQFSEPETKPNSDQFTAEDAFESITVLPVEPEDGPGSAIVRRSKAGDLIQREITIEDLRPTTDDYLVLTDEIRLAGRFAAVGLIAQGLRLARIKEENIYKDHYPNFEEYCRKEHKMSATYAYRLMRMADMADHLANRAGRISATMVDPFEVLLGLGHRHILALLPLELDTAEEILVRGIAVAADDPAKRVPLTQATEKQIRAALKVIAPGSTKVVAEKRSLASEKQLIPALSKLVEMLEDWSVWLGGEAPPELKAARMGRGPLLARLAKRFRNAADKIGVALETEETRE